MFVSGKDIRGRKIYIPRGRGEKRLQSAMLQYYRKQNAKIITSLLRENHRLDLLRKIQHLQITSQTGKPPVGWDL
jgi:hypothetical protein